jgi:hypothetical protein
MRPCETLDSERGMPMDQIRLVPNNRQRLATLTARRSSAALLGLCVMLCSVTALDAAPQDETPRPTASDNTLRMAMRNVVLYPYGDVSARVTELSGTVASTRPPQPVVMDDVASYEVQVAYAEMHMDARSLTNLMNRYILPAADSPIRHVDIAFNAGSVTMTGTMVKAGVPVPFSATATLQPTAHGEMQMHVTSMRAAGVVPKGLMDALGLDLATVAPPENSRIFRLEGDNMILPIVSMFPPPKFIGQLSAVRVTPQEMVSTIGQRVPLAKPPVPAESYLHLHGGTVTFAKLTMHDTDLTMVPKDRVPLLRFSPAHYYQQLLAGYSVSLPDRGLVGYVADYPAVANTSR